MTGPAERPSSETAHQGQSGWSEDLSMWSIHAANDGIVPARGNVCIPMFSPNRTFGPNNQAPWRSGQQPPPPHHHANGQSTYYIALADSQFTGNASGHTMLVFRKGDHLLAKQTNGGWYWGCVQGKETEVEHGYFNPNLVQLVDNNTNAIVSVEEKMETTLISPDSSNAATEAKSSKPSTPTSPAPPASSKKLSPKETPSKDLQLQSTKCLVHAATKGYGRRSDWSVTIDCPACMDSIAISLTLGLIKEKESIRSQIEKRYKCTLWKAVPLNGYKASGCVIKVAADIRENANQAAFHVANLLQAEAKNIEKNIVSTAGKRGRDVESEADISVHPDQKCAKRSKTTKEKQKTKAPKWCPPPKLIQQEMPPTTIPTESNSKCIAETKSSVQPRHTTQKLESAKKPQKPFSVDRISDGADNVAEVKQSQAPLPSSYIELSPEIAIDAKFPQGCPVVHSSGDDNIVSGFVRSVHLKLTSPVLLSGKSTYDVCYKLATEGNFLGESSELPFLEKDLQFATRCPVLIPASFAPLTLQTNGCNDLLQGSVVSSFKSIGEQAESYIIDFAGGRANGVPRESIRFRPPSWKPPAQQVPEASGCTCDNTSKPLEPPVAVVSTADDASKVSEVSSPPSTVGDAHLQSPKCLLIPPCIKFDAVKAHLYGDNGDISKRMGRKLGVEVHVIGDNLQPAGDQNLKAYLPPPASKGKYPACILLKGMNRQLTQAVRVVAHILVEKAYGGNDKGMVRKQILGEGVDMNPNDEIKSPSRFKQDDSLIEFVQSVNDPVPFSNTVSDAGTKQRSSPKKKQKTGGGGGRERAYKHFVDFDITPGSFIKRYGKKSKCYNDRPQIDGCKLCPPFILRGVCGAGSSCKLKKSHINRPLKSAERGSVEKYVEKCNAAY